MSKTDATKSTPDDDSDTTTDSDAATLAAELDILQEENKRLREEYVRAQHAQYRQTAVALVAIGLAATVAGALVPNARTVLIAVGSTGIFLGVLTYYLTPEQFLSASVNREVYSSLARNEMALVSELGLSDKRVYIPRGMNMSFEDVRLFVPHHAEYELPAQDELTDLLVVTDRDSERGVSFRPAGSALAGEFNRALAGEVGSHPTVVAEQLTDALVEQFELVKGATTETDTDDGRVTVSVTDGTYGPIEQFDHPVASFIAVGMAGVLGVPLELTVETSEDDDRGDTLVTCRWNPADVDEDIAQESES
jgi:hypothetical protein